MFYLGDLVRWGSVPFVCGSGFRTVALLYSSDFPAEGGEPTVYVFVAWLSSVYM